MTTNSTHLSWSSPTLPLLTSDDSPIGVTITSSQSSWIVSIRSLGSICGCLLAMLTIDYLGRKKTLLLATVPFLVAWIMIFFAKAVVILYIARFIAGLGSGLASTVVPIYNSEIAEKDIRGRLSNFMTVLGLFGSLYVYTIGPFVSYWVLAGTCAIFPLVALICCWFLPESPYYLVRRNKIKEARKSLITLSNHDVDDSFIQSRCQEIEEALKTDAERKSKFWELVTRTEYRKPFIIVTGLKTIQHLSGAQSIGAYMQTIIEASGSSLPSNYASIIFGVVQFISALFAGQVVDKFGRKPLLLISCISCAVALFGEGAYFYIREATDGNTDPIAWLPTTALVLYELMVTTGISSLPYVIIGELFTMNIKGVAVSFNTVYGAALGFAMNNVYLPVSEAWGTYTMFWAYGTTTVLGAIFILVLMPETKNKTFDEIQRKLNKVLK